MTKQRFVIDQHEYQWNSETGIVVNAAGIMIVFNCKTIEDAKEWTRMFIEEIHEEARQRTHNLIYDPYDYDV